MSEVGLNDDDSLDTYELAYNQACKLISQGQHVKAEKLLQKSLKMCEDFYKEEMEEDEDEDDEDMLDRETASIKAQLAYCLQMQGRDKEALTLYNNVLRARPDDLALTAVIANNIIGINKDQNIFDSKKRIKTATADGVEHKLTFSARKTIARNHAVLAMTTNQVDLCRSLLKALKADFGRSRVDEEDCKMIEAGVLARSGKVKEAIKAIMSGSANLETSLIAASIHLERGEVKGALEVLTKLDDSDKFRFGLIGSIVALFSALDDRDGAAAFLKQAVEYHRKAKTGGMEVVWRKTAEFHLKGQSPEVAADSLEQLLKANPKDRRCVAQLVLAYAKFDLKKALECSQRLPPFKDVNVDVDALETASFLGTKYAKKVATQNLASPKRPKDDDVKEEEAPQKKKRRKRVKRRLPKNYNPNVDPDPERWIPRRERVGFKKSRKDRRKGEKFTGAQGTAAGQQENFDYSKKGAVPKSPQAGQSVQEAPVGPRQQHRKPNKANKGKKNKNRF